MVKEKSENPSDKADSLSIELNQKGVRGNAVGMIAIWALVALVVILGALWINKNPAPTVITNGANSPAVGGDHFGDNNYNTENAKEGNSASDTANSKRNGASANTGDNDKHK